MPSDNAPVPSDPADVTGPDARSSDGSAEGPAGSAVSPARSRRAWLAVGAAITLLIAAGVAWLLARGSGHPTASPTPSPTHIVTRPVLGPNSLIETPPNLCAFIKPPAIAHYSTDDSFAIPDGGHLAGARYAQICSMDTNTLQATRSVDVREVVFSSVAIAHTYLINARRQFSPTSPDRRGSGYSNEVDVPEIGGGAFAVFDNLGSSTGVRPTGKPFTYSTTGSAVTAQYKNIAIDLDWTGTDFSTDATGQTTGVGLAYTPSRQVAITLTQQILASLH